MCVNKMISGVLKKIFKFSVIILQWHLKSECLQNEDISVKQYPGRSLSVDSSLSLQKSLSPSRSGRVVTTNIVLITKYSDKSSNEIGIHCAASTTPSKKSRTGSLVKPRDTALQATRRETPVICEATNINFVEQSQHHPVEKERAAEPGVSSPQSPQKEPKTAEVRALLSFCLFFCFTVNVYP